MTHRRSTSLCRTNGSSFPLANRSRVGRSSAGAIYQFVWTVALDHYRPFNEAAGKGRAYQFVWHEPFCDWYLEAIAADPGDGCRDIE
jgi:hypothetical protein